MRVGVLNRVGNDIAQLGLDDFQLRMILERQLELVITNGADRHAIKAIEHQHVTLATCVLDQLPGQCLAGGHVVGRGVVEAVLRGRIDGEQRNTRLADALEPRVDNTEGAEGLDHRIGLLRDHGLQLIDQILVVATGIERDGRAAQALDLIHLRLEGLDIEVVAGAGHADRYAFAGQRRHIAVLGIRGCDEAGGQQGQHQSAPYCMQAVGLGGRDGIRHSGGSAGSGKQS
ncbi:Unknown protein sequence [Pseudomonas syringae pv. coryli]|uniref:Uncharacterized protein n=1 Tax=Pseudomonas syringae pv. coryli TaxID=317659 RepID=A0A0P9NDF0_9PSED|nr:Unknown protein sequence [Pseudomonas syringae pv. coryli]